MNWPADCFSDQFQRLISRIGNQSTKRKVLDMLKVAKRCRFVGLGYAVAAAFKLLHQVIFIKFIKIYVHACIWHDDPHKKATAWVAGLLGGLLAALHAGGARLWQHLLSAVMGQDAARACTCSM